MTTVVVPSGETVAASGFVIYAKDYQRLVDFYAAMLQLQIIEREDDFCLIGGDRFELVIVQAPADIAKQISISHPPVPRASVALKPVFFIDDIPIARALAQSKGGRVSAPEQEWRFRHHTVCDGHDPEGNIFQLRASGPSPGLR